MNGNNHFGRGFAHSGQGPCRGMGRGRRRVERRVDPTARYHCFVPVSRDQLDENSVILHHDEIELIRLIDLEGLNQEEAASVLGVSRKTAWRDLHEARRKIAFALVNGFSIEVPEND